MLRIQPNSNPDPKAQELLNGVKKSLGSVPNMFKTLANSPSALAFYVGALEATKNSKLTPSLKQQIALTVAGADGCDYCASAHTTFGKMVKIKEDELSKNLQAKSNDKKTQVALNFVHKIVEGRGNVSDSDLDAVRRAGFSDGEIAEIITETCINIFTNYFNLIAGTEVDFPLVSTEEFKLTLTHH